MDQIALISGPSDRQLVHPRTTDREILADHQRFVQVHNPLQASIDENCPAWTHVSNRLAQRPGHIVFEGGDGGGSKLLLQEEPHRSEDSQKEKDSKKNANVSSRAAGAAGT